MSEPKPPSRKSSVGKDKCSSCSKVISEKDDGIQCEICQTWFHPKYGYVQKCTNIQWYCDTYNKGIGQVVEELSKVKNRQENTEVMTQKANNEIDSVTKVQMNSIRLELSWTNTAVY